MTPRSASGGPPQRPYSVSRGASEASARSFRANTRRVVGGTNLRAGSGPCIRRAFALREHPTAPASLSLLPIPPQKNSFQSIPKPSILANTERRCTQSEQAFISSRLFSIHQPWPETLPARFLRLFLPGPAPISVAFHRRRSHPRIFL